MLGFIYVRHHSRALPSPSYSSADANADAADDTEIDDAAIRIVFNSLYISLLLMTMMRGPTRRSTRFAIFCTAGNKRFPLISMNTTSTPPSRSCKRVRLSGFRKTSQHKNSNDGYCSLAFLTLFVLLSIPTALRARIDRIDVVTPKSLPISTQKSDERTHAFAIRR